MKKLIYSSTEDISHDTLSWGHHIKLGDYNKFFSIKLNKYSIRNTFILPIIYNIINIFHTVYYEPARWTLFHHQ